MISQNFETGMHDWIVVMHPGVYRCLIISLQRERKAPIEQHICL
jgi:hypothetical protein